MTKIAVSLPEDVASFLDRLVTERRFPSRSRAVAEAARCLEKAERERRYQEALKALDSSEERGDASLFAERESEWPKY